MKLTWILDTSGPAVELDLTPRLAVLASGGQQNPIYESRGQLRNTKWVYFSQEPYTQIIDMAALYLEMLDYKQMCGYVNLHITPQKYRKSPEDTMLRKITRK